jgi:hypothetical protein
VEREPRAAGLGPELAIDRERSLRRGERFFGAAQAIDSPASAASTAARSDSSRSIASPVWPSRSIAKTG